METQHTSQGEADDLGADAKVPEGVSFGNQQKLVDRLYGLRRIPLTTLDWQLLGLVFCRVVEPNTLAYICDCSGSPDAGQPLST